MVTLGTNEELKFYMQFAKSMVCYLKKAKDRVLASSWITKLQNESFAPLKTRIDFIKLLLVILQRERLLGPFARDPTDLQTLQQFIGDTKLPDIVKRILKEDVGSLTSLDAICPPYQIEYSPDLTQYASTQEIPNFGAQVYFATSNEPLQLWFNVPRKTSLKIARKKPKPKPAIRSILRNLGNFNSPSKPSSSLFESLFSSCSSCSTWMPPSWGSQFVVAETGNLRDNSKKSISLFESLGDIASSCSSSTWKPPSWGSQFMVAEQGNLRVNCKPSSNLSGRKNLKDNSIRSSNLSESLEDLEDFSSKSNVWMPPSSWASQFLKRDNSCSCTECLISSNSSI